MSVVILVIVHKADPSPYEIISLQQCAKIFGKRDIVFICPAGLDVQQYKKLSPSFKFDFIDPKWQKNYAQFNRLKVVPLLYKKYSAFKYSFFYEPDAFVFEDKLDEWCGKDYDYIGAPWFTNFSSNENTGDFMGVGNGGFSLRKNSSHLKVLNTFSFLTSPRENWSARFSGDQVPGSAFKKAAGFLLDHTVRNNTHKWLNNFGGYEDQFWGLFVAKRIKWFKVPGLKEAADFSFEMQPHRLYELTGGKLPMGCHAWWKYDLDFWKPHIEKFGYNLNLQN